MATGIRIKMDQFLEPILNKKNRTYLVGAIILGLVLGFGMNNLLTSPQISSLSTRVEEIQTTLDEVQNNYDQLSTSHNQLTQDHETLQAEFDELSSTSVTLEDYNELRDDYDALMDENQAKDQEIDQLWDTVNSQNEQLNAVKDKYDNLLERYNKVRIPKSVSMIIYDMDVNLTVDKTTHDQLDPLTGTISIYYLNGTKFRGSVEFRIESDFLPIGKSDFDPVTLRGEEDYSLKNAFFNDQGRYNLGLSKIINKKGRTIADLNELKYYTVLVEMA